MQVESLEDGILRYRDGYQDLDHFLVLSNWTMGRVSKKALHSTVARVAYWCQQISIIG